MHEFILKIGTMLRNGLRQLQSWMTKRRTLRHQKKQKHDQESMIREKHLIDLSYGSKKKFTATNIEHEYIGQ
jgi:hypothetical protein